MPASIYIRGGAGGGQTCAPAADPGALVACNCEKVKLKFTVAQPRFRVECCCVDCNDAHRWAESKGGPKDSGMGRGADLWYFENDLQVLSGNEHIAFFVLDDGYATTRLVATCCYSTLCVSAAAPLRLLSKPQRRGCTGRSPGLHGQCGRGVRRLSPVGHLHAAADAHQH